MVTITLLLAFRIRTTYKGGFNKSIEKRTTYRITTKAVITTIS